MMNIQENVRLALNTPCPTVLWKFFEVLIPSLIDCTITMTVKSTEDLYHSPNGNTAAYKFMGSIERILIQLHAKFSTDWSNYFWVESFFWITITGKVGARVWVKWWRGVTLEGLANYSWVSRLGRGTSPTIIINDN